MISKIATNGSDDISHPQDTSPSHCNEILIDIWQSTAYCAAHTHRLKGHRHQANAVEQVKMYRLRPDDVLSQIVNDISSQKNFFSSLNFEIKMPSGSLIKVEITNQLLSMEVRISTSNHALQNTIKNKKRTLENRLQKRFEKRVNIDA